MSAYVVMIREHVTDQAEMDTYARLAPRAREGHDIERLAFYGALDTLEGAPPDGVVIHRFPTMEDTRSLVGRAVIPAARVLHGQPGLRGCACPPPARRGVPRLHRRRRRCKAGGLIAAA